MDSPLSFLRAQAWLLPPLFNPQERTRRSIPACQCPLPSPCHPASVLARQLPAAIYRHRATITRYSRAVSHSPLRTNVFTSTLKPAYLHSSTQGLQHRTAHLLLRTLTSGLTGLSICPTTFLRPVPLIPVDRKVRWPLSNRHHLIKSPTVIKRPRRFSSLQAQVPTLDPRTRIWIPTRTQMWK